MATQKKHSRPGRTLIVLGLVTAALFAAMGAFSSWTPKLGLDLQGGTTITLTAANTSGDGQVDPASLELARGIIAQRVNSLGVGESEVTTSGGTQITVSVPNVQQDELVRLVGQTALLTFRNVYDIQQGGPAPEGDPGAQPSTGEPGADPGELPGTEPGAEPPADQPAEADPSASETAPGNRRPVMELPTAPPEPRKARPTEPGQGMGQDQALEYQPSQQDTEDFAAFQCKDKFVEVSDQPLFACDDSGAKLLLGPALIKGDELTDASAGVPQGELQWKVNLTFNPQGATQFEKATGQLAQNQPPMNQFAIVLDGKVISAPSVSQAISGGRAEISGSFDQSSANALANVLKYGALPLAFDVSSVDNVSATLGGEQLQAGLIAGGIGLLLVVAFTLFAYRGLAIVVIGSLVAAASLTYAAMTLLGESVGFALNLPGIAGVIVAIGMTADSFVIYFERIRDEIRDGRTLRSAVESGWRKSKQTILIADAVQLLSAVVLFILAVGGIKGFAFTLGLTTVIDIAVVFFFTKPLVTILAKTKFFGDGHKLSGLNAAHLGVTKLPGLRRRAQPKEA